MEVKAPIRMRDSKYPKKVKANRPSPAPILHFREGFVLAQSLSGIPATRKYPMKVKATGHAVLPNPSLPRGFVLA
jgi:hypothetical protein